MADIVQGTEVDGEPITDGELSVEIKEIKKVGTQNLNEEYRGQARNVNLISYMDPC
jgi:hypothetical protein